MTIAEWLAKQRTPLDAETARRHDQERRQTIRRLVGTKPGRPNEIDATKWLFGAEWRDGSLADYGLSVLSSDAEIDRVAVDVERGAREDHDTILVGGGAAAAFRGEIDRATEYWRRLDELSRTSCLRSLEGFPPPSV